MLLVVQHVAENVFLIERGKQRVSLLRAARRRGGQQCRPTARRSSVISAWSSHVLPVFGWVPCMHLGLSSLVILLGANESVWVVPIPCNPM